MGSRRNPKTGRFEVGVREKEELERRLRQDEIIERFVKAGQMPPGGLTPIPVAVRRRWIVPVVLAVGVVAGVLIGVAAKDRQLQPTIHYLRSSLASAADTGAALAEGSIDLRRQVGELQAQNARLAQERGGALQANAQGRATAKAASGDLRRADRALQYDQSVDRISDRAKTWEALRAVEKAERRLNQQP